MGRDVTRLRNGLSTILNEFAVDVLIERMGAALQLYDELAAVESGERSAWPQRIAAVNEIASQFDGFVTALGDSDGFVQAHLLTAHQDLIEQLEQFHVTLMDFTQALQLKRKGRGRYPERLRAMIVMNIADVLEDCGVPLTASENEPFARTIRIVLEFVEAAHLGTVREVIEIEVGRRAKSTGKLTAAEGELIP